MAGTARSIYSSGGVIRQFSALGGANADELLIDKMDAISAPGTLNISLFGSLGATDTIQIGGAGSKTFILGDFEVDGNEVINGNATFEGTTTIGNATSDEVLFVARVASDLTFKTSTGARSITTDGTSDLTITTTGASDLVVDSAATSSLSSATGTTIGATLGGVGITPAAGGVNINPVLGNVTINTTGAAATSQLSSANGTTVTAATGKNVNLTAVGAAGELLLASAATTANALSLTASAAAGFVKILASGAAGGVTIDASSSGSISLDATAASNFTVTGNTLTLTTTGANVLTLNSGSTYVGTTTSAANAALSLVVDSGGTPTNARVDVGALATPVHAAPNGTLYLNTAGAPFYRAAGAWTQVGSATGFTSLQNAYNTGNTIETTAASNITFESLYNGGVTPSEFIVRHEGGGDNFLTTTTTSATAGTLDLGSTNVTIKPFNNIAFDTTSNPARSIELGGSGTLTLNQSGTGALTVSTTATGLLSVVGAAGVTTTATTGALMLQASAAAATTTLQSSGAGGLVVVAAGSGVGSVTVNANGVTTGAGVFLNATGTAGAISLTTAATGTITVGASGSPGPVVTNSTTLDMNASSGVTLDGTTISIDGTATTSNLTLTNASAVLSVLSVGAGAALNLSAGGGHLALSTTNAGNISLTPNGAGLIQLVAPGGGVTISSSDAEVMGIYTNDATPEGDIVATQGSLALVHTGAVGELYLKTANVTNLGWSKVALFSDIPAAVTLPIAYQNSAAGATVVIPMVADKGVEFDTLYHATTPSNFAVRLASSGNPYILTSTVGGDTAGVLQLGSTSNVKLNMSGQVASNITFDGTAGRTLTNAGTMTVSTTGANLLTLSGGGGATLTSASTYDTSVTATGTGGDVRLSTATDGVIYLGASASRGNINVEAAALNCYSTGITYLAASEHQISTHAGSNGNVYIIPNGTGVTGINTLSPTGGYGLTVDDSSVGCISLIGTNRIINSLDAVMTLRTTSTGAAYNLNLIAGDSGIGSVVLTANGATGEVSFQAHSSNVTEFNSATAGEVDLNSDLPQNLVGAINYIYEESGGATIAVTSGEAFAIGDALYLKTSDGRAWKSDANVEASSVFIGFAKTAATAAAQSRVAFVSGECIVNTDLSAGGDNAPVGSVVFLSGTGGGITKSAPSGSGDTVLKVGVVTVQGTIGTAKVAIQVGTPIVL